MKSIISLAVIALLGGNIKSQYVRSSSSSSKLTSLDDLFKALSARLDTIEDDIHQLQSSTQTQTSQSSSTSKTTQKPSSDTQNPTSALIDQYLAKSKDQLSKQIADQLNESDIIYVQDAGVADTLDKIMQEQLLKQTSIIASGDDEINVQQDIERGHQMMENFMRGYNTIEQYRIQDALDNAEMMPYVADAGVASTIEKIIQEQILQATSIVASGGKLSVQSQRQNESIGQIIVELIERYVQMMLPKKHNRNMDGPTVLDAGVAGTIDKIIQEQILKSVSEIASSTISVQAASQTIQAIKEEEIYKNIANMLGGSSTAATLSSIEQLELLKGASTAGENLNVQVQNYGQRRYGYPGEEPTRYSRRY